MLLRLRHYAYCTEQAYLRRIKHFIPFHYGRHSREMDIPEIEAFLMHERGTFRLPASGRGCTSGQGVV